jgi:hypothetical protein
MFDLDIGRALCWMCVIAAIVGWAVIEGALWLLSLIRITIA